MKLNEPIGNPIFAPLLIRLTLGGYFLVSGFGSLNRISDSVAAIERLQIFPQHIATMYGILLPYLQLVGGALLFLGAWTTLAAILGALIMLAFVIAFGTGGGFRGFFNKELIMFAASISLLFSGSGAFSVDRFRKMG